MENNFFKEATQLSLFKKNESSFQLSLFEEKELKKMKRDKIKKDKFIEDEIYNLLLEKGLDPMDYYSPLICKSNQINNNE